MSTYYFSQDDILRDQAPAKPANVLPPPVLIDLNNSCQVSGLQVGARDLNTIESASSLQPPASDLNGGELPGRGTGG